MNIYQLFVFLNYDILLCIENYADSILIRLIFKLPVQITNLLISQK